MTDYSAFPFEPIVQGVVTFGVGADIFFNGRGVSLVTRPVGFPAGVFVLQLDAGLPGNAGAVAPGVSPFLNPNVRTVLTMRSTTIPPIPSIATVAVNYLLSPLAGVGADRILVVTQTLPTALADPHGGFEIITWKTRP